MTYRLFEGKEHASTYQKYRFTPPEELKNIILQYLDEKKGRPHGLAVDLGCGTGQNSRLLAPHFREVVGVDISECQLEEARAVAGPSNITYRKGTAEELSFPDCSVDLLTAASAAHWFDQSRFLAEAARVLKPRGCVALLGFSDPSTSLRYQGCGDRLDRLFQEVKQTLLPYTSTRVTLTEGKLEELYSAIPFPDKERQAPHKPTRTYATANGSTQNKHGEATALIERVPVTSSISVRNLVGFIESFSMFQGYKKKDPTAAGELLLNTEKRFLEEMGVESPDTEVEQQLEYFCVLASKPG
ncbi:putative methyltransferase [Liparis tanakae]|uniref:Putative methyltransferase n=1 Tax=Liparis tanakae TaxID=230148 RepID=A0A4Z2GEJ9_9TELE|nr:putative methyltransferase [Liparis tanakae]